MTSSNENDIFIYIMAGGSGTRFAPLSTPEKPKQFLKIINDKSLLRQTYERVKGITSNVYIGVNVSHINHIYKELPGFDVNKVLMETEMKNTGPAIAHAAQFFFKINPKAVMVCVPADHYIHDEKKFVQVVEEACSVARYYRMVVTLGMKPTYPSTEYGYIKKGALIINKRGNQVYKVKRFVEKPNLEKATDYLKEGSYYWNGGIFVWGVCAALWFYKKCSPDIYRALSILGDGTDKSRIINYYKSVPRISVDYAIMEKSDNDIGMIPADIGWNDVGTWESLDRFIKKNKSIIMSGDFIDYLNGWKKKGREI